MDDFYQKIERYLLGELSEPEQAAFENALQADAALAQSVAQHREMMQRLEALRLRNLVKSTTIKQTNSITTRKPKLLYWMVAVSLLVLATTFWYFNRSVEQPPPAPPANLPVPTTQTPVEKKQTPAPEQPKEKLEAKPNLIALAREFQEKPSQSLVRDAAQTSNPATQTTTEQATEAFFNKNYRLAAQLLQDDQIVLPAEELRFIRASARLNAGQFEGAAADFDALKGSFQFKHEARWNFLLCQLALGKNKEASILLQAFADDADFPFRQKALELRSKLNF